MSASLGDIKSVWEPGRFAWVFDLIRGYLATGKDAYVRSFFEHFETWMASSPPFVGPHWSCGQETAIRAIALLYAESAFRDSIAGNQRGAALVSVLGWSGERIADAIGYAISQRNNHGLSEAAGLVALGHRLSGLHPEATKWVQIGTRLLNRLLVEQFADDGWYAQHSFNYMRVALDQCLVAQLVLSSRGTTLEQDALSRIRAAADLLSVVVDPATGAVPNLGANDGSMVLPITSADYRDYRPHCTALAAVFGVPLPAGVLPDPEVLAWVGGSEPIARPPLADRLTTGRSGWAAAQLGAFRIFFRAGAVTNRPSHLDQLTVSLSVDGREFLVDAGTYSYNAPAPWRNGLAAAMAHNAPIANGVEPGVQGPRFLWLEWANAVLNRAVLEGGRLVLEGEITGQVRRRVEADRGAVVITDSVLGSGLGSLEARWLLHPTARPDLIETTPDAETVEADENSVVGWFSPYYGERVASRAVVLKRPPGTVGDLTLRVRAR